MTKENNLSRLVKGMIPKLHSGEYVFSTLKDVSKISRKDTLCEFKEQEGTTVIINKKKADKLHLSYEYVAAWITLTVHSSLNDVGLTAVVSAELAKHNISCNVVSACCHDHIFVDAKDSDKAIVVLMALSNS